MVCVSLYRRDRDCRRARQIGAAIAGTTFLALGIANPASAATWQPFFRLAPPPDYAPPPPPSIHHRAPVQRPSAIRPRHERERAASRRQRIQAAKDDVAPARMPEGPLTISISLSAQELKIFDANGLFAESKISSGKPGHSTPRGVFSIIQKRKWHRSNLYANAPMPYMQRITWSGVALHAGALPGYPASHGCVRLPNAFAAKLWRWTTMGARVIIAHDELTPADVTHPNLLARLPDAAPAEPEAATKDRTVPADGEPSRAQPDKADAKKAEGEFGLRLTLDADAPHAQGVRTADASGAVGGEALPVAGDRDEYDAGADGPEDIPATTGSAPHAPRAPQDGNGGHAAAAPPAAQWSYWPGATLAALRPPPAERGHVAMFVSRKDGKIYVRRDFRPWFDVPVTIKDSERALGTHVFTARLGGDDKRALHWSAVSITERPAAQDVSARKGKSRKEEKAAAAPVAPATAREALDRLSMPDEVLAAVGPLLGNGASLVISDKGLGPETGLGTDFIVLTR